MLRPDYHVIFRRTSASNGHPLQHALGLTPVFASQTTGFKNSGACLVVNLLCADDTGEISSCLLASNKAIPTMNNSCIG